MFCRIISEPARTIMNIVWEADRWQCITALSPECTWLARSHYGCDKRRLPSWLWFAGRAHLRGEETAKNGKTHRPSSPVHVSQVRKHFGGGHASPFEPVYWKCRSRIRWTLKSKSVAALLVSSSHYPLRARPPFFLVAVSALWFQICLLYLSRPDAGMKGMSVLRTRGKSALALAPVSKTEGRAPSGQIQTHGNALMEFSVTSYIFQTVLSRMQLRCKPL